MPLFVHRNLSLSLSLSLCLFSHLLGQSVEINRIAIEKKANGTLIRIGNSGEIDRSQITAWTSASGWLYVTLVGSTIDTSRAWPFVPTGSVSQFEAHQLPDAVQLNFRLSQDIESLDIGVSPSGEEIMITLRSPLIDVLGTIDRLGSTQGDEIPETTSVRVPHALMTVGGGLVAIGLIRSSSLEFVAGSTILVTGYILLKKDTANRQ